MRLFKKHATKKQRKAFKYAMEHPYSILAVDPRLGKSLVVIAIQQKLRNNCLILCPSYLTTNWEKECRKWSRPDTQITAFKKGKDIYEPCDSDFVIISFDLAQKAEHLFEWADMVAIDEFQHLSKMSTKRSQFIHRAIFENSVKRVHGVTGTILKNRVREFYSPLSMMFYNPNIPKVSLSDINTPGRFLDRFEDEITFADYFSFREEYKVRIKDKRGRQYSMPIAKWEGLRNLSELKRYRKGKYIRIKAGKDDLPPVVDRPILISDSPDKALLDQFNSYFRGDGATSITLDAKEIAAIKKRNKNNPASISAKLAKALEEKKKEYKSRVKSVKVDAKYQAALKKAPFTIKYVEDLLCEVECVLVYSDHIPVVEEIAKHFGIPAITGKMPSSRRAQLATEFQEGKGRVLCATIGSLKEGRDLFRSKDLVLSDPPWIPSDLQQVVNRMRGLGEKSPRTLHRILGSPQDDHIYDVLKEKQETITGATD